MLFSAAITCAEFCQPSTFSDCITTVLFKQHQKRLARRKKGVIRTVLQQPICGPWLSFPTSEDNVQQSCLSVVAADNQIYGF